MRMYSSCVEMYDETFREIWKRGQTIFDKTVQGKIVSEQEYEQKEIVFYAYRLDAFNDVEQMLIKAKETFEKEHLTIDVAKAWFNDMIYNCTLKEEWWNLTEYSKDYFEKFCKEETGLASYSYGERIMPQLEGLFERLSKNIFSRGAIIIMPNQEDINKIGRRVPCTVSYHFIARPTIDGIKLNLIVNQRSADAINFFPLDLAKSYLFLEWVCKTLKIDMGYIIHSVDSLHVYAKDIPNKYKW